MRAIGAIACSSTCVMFPIPVGGTNWKDSGCCAFDVSRAQLAVALNYTENDGLIRVALRSRHLFASVFVLLVAAHKSGVGLDSVLERCRERLGAGRMAKAMKDKPSGLLSDLEVLRERGASDALGMVGDQPNSDEPLAEWKLGVLKDRTNLDRKPLPAVGALERLFVAEMHDAATAAVRAKLAPTPAYRS